MKDPELKRVTSTFGSIFAIAFLAFLALVLAVPVASADGIASLGSDIGTALGIGATAGGLVITVCVVMCADLVLGVVGAGFQIMLVVDVMIAGLMTAIGWLDAGIFIIILVIVALMFSPSITKIFWPGGSGV